MNKRYLNLISLMLSVALCMPAVAQRRSRHTAPSAKSLLERTLRKYDNIKSIVYSATDDLGTRTITFSPAGTRERDPKVEWSVHNSILTILDRTTKTAYTGKGTDHSAIVLLPKLGVRVDVTLRHLWVDENPFRAILPAKYKFEPLGSITLQKRACRIIELKSAKRRLSFVVDSRTGQILRVIDEALNANGTSFSHTELTFTGVKVGAAVPASAFSLPIPKDYKKIDLKVLRAKK